MDSEIVALADALAARLEETTDADDPAERERAQLLLSHARLLEEQSRIAETLQRSLVPPPLATWAGIELAAGLQPAEAGTEVCGDFYDSFEASDGSLVVLIGDVTGRGVAAAGLTGMVRHTLRALAYDMTPSEALTRLNRALVQSSAGGEPRMLTAGVVRLLRRPEGVRAEVSLAGQCLPILVRGRHATQVGAAGTLLGAFSRISVGIQEIDLRPDDVLLLHTDGVLEARRNGVEFGEERLLRLLSAMDHPTPAGVVEHMLTSVGWYRTTAPDDMAVLALRA